MREAKDLRRAQCLYLEQVVWEELFGFGLASGTVPKNALVLRHFWVLTSAHVNEELAALRHGTVTDFGDQLYATFYLPFVLQLEACLSNIVHLVAAITSENHRFSVLSEAAAVDFGYDLCVVHH